MAQIRIQIIFEGHFIRIFEYLNIRAHHWLLYLPDRWTARPPVGGAPLCPEVCGGEEQGAGQDDHPTKLRHIKNF